MTIRETGDIVTDSTEPGAISAPMAGRTPRRLRFMLGLAAVVAAVAVIVLSAVHATRPERGLLDLGSFMHAGASYSKGLNPYAENRGVRPKPLYKSLNLNPPISVYPFSAISRFDLQALRVLFFGESLFLFAAIVGVLAVAFPEHRNPVSILSVTALAGLWYVLEYNQIYMPLVAAITGAWLLMRRGEWLLAGVLIGLVIAIKPQFGILALVLFAAQYRRPAMAAFATAGGVSLIPLLIEGPTIYRQWLQTLREFEGTLWPGNASLFAVGGRLESPALGYALIAVMLVTALAWAWRTRPSVTDAASVGIIAVILTGPTSWPGYTLFLLPVLFSRSWDWRIWTALVLFAVPQWFVVSTAVSSTLADLTVGNINVWGMLLVLGATLAKPAHATAAADREADVPAARPGGMSAEAAAA
ncbi:MAG: glycosyltransferase family 87 protein [Dehalococcoidia bacterium]